MLEEILQHGGSFFYAVYQRRRQLRSCALTHSRSASSQIQLDHWKPVSSFHWKCLKTFAGWAAPPLNSQLSFPRFVRNVWQHFLPEKLSDQFCSTLVILVALQATQHSDSTQRMSVFLEMFGPWKHLPRVAVFTRSLGGARNPCCMHTMWFFHFRWCPQLQDGSLDRGQTSLSLLFSQNQVIIVAASKITSISLSSQV